MSKEKAYKLLAIQEGISNNEAKDLIDDGLVSLHGEKLSIARGLVDTKAKFSVQKIAKPAVIFQDENIMAINKPPFITSEKIATMFKFELLNRLDKETSGVLLLVKNDEFKEEAIKEFKKLNVEKIYIAVVNGIVSEEISVDEPILTIKGKGGAISKISPLGKTALSKIHPIMVSGKKSLVKVVIKTGRTHQIRVHLASLGYGVIGDEKYGKNRSKRMFLHAYKTSLLGYEFIAPLADFSFNEFGFEISKNMKF
ncbi:pseudouridine synthase family protein [Campylobacter geochelonis]|uniref:RNA pseudouridylate synthase n=1 Tax=Campylobacter geochelonis TaxID=1780362 RepID=A0A128EDI4_9BACT|nr:RluA family pseudouridine synthase [Campylobacter geochelonis]QKF70928.1 23S rRNA and tRNA pseudouridine synthase [Campylobacter geochelonis]CZE46979.1 ribosomal large subunit pseudouridine synthase C [Campylobacter geochelonis]CZE49081.1 ribosomal large subunit pseudouridine synthase C [Campylobacter geochelonis]CZE51225.1 ribosomal large subunit pseudouridine synthase C [Campylobacter geochelonis]